MMDGSRRHSMPWRFETCLERLDRRRGNFDVVGVDEADDGRQDSSFINGGQGFERARPGECGRVARGRGDELGDCAGPDDRQASNGRLTARVVMLELCE